jgi:hypothetical protein
MCNLVYVACTENMTSEQRADFDSDLNAPLNPAVRAGMEQLHAALGAI